MAGDIRVNRAPVLTLWAAVVAERLGHDADAAVTLGRAVAGSSARVKARAIGLEPDEHRDEGKERAGEAATPAERRAVPARTVRLLGRDIPVVAGKGGLRALDHGEAASPARAYVERAFGEHLPAVKRAMERLAASMPAEELNRVGFHLYEHFRPEVPAGAKGWGAKGVSTCSGSRTPTAPEDYAAATPPGRRPPPPRRDRWRLLFWPRRRIPVLV